MREVEHQPPAPSSWTVMTMWQFFVIFTYLLIRWVVLKVLTCFGHGPSSTSHFNLQPFSHRVSVYVPIPQILFLRISLHFRLWKKLFFGCPLPQRPFQIMLLHTLEGQLGILMRVPDAEPGPCWKETGTWNRRRKRNFSDFESFLGFQFFFPSPLLISL